MTPDERQALRDGLNEAQTKSHSPQVNRGVHEASLAYSQEHIFERLSVAREHEVLTEALRHGRGNVDLSDLQGSLSLERAKGTLISSGDEIATQASLQRERDMIAIPCWPRYSAPFPHRKAGRTVPPRLTGSSRYFIRQCRHTRYASPVYFSQHQRPND
jgi:hypothetical protein